MTRITLSIAVHAALALALAHGLPLWLYFGGVALAPLPITK